MCIRDRWLRDLARDPTPNRIRRFGQALVLARELPEDIGRLCLLYTSDAADERSSVDLGGRRIIKKKKKINTHS